LFYNNSLLHYGDPNFWEAKAMDETMTFTPTLSSGFERAGKISRSMAILFAIGFWGALLLAVSSVILLIPGVPGSIKEGDIALTFTGLGFPQRQVAVVALDVTLIPIAFLLYHARRVFSQFAKGKVFTPDVVGHIQGAGAWLIAFFFADIVTHLALMVAGMLPHGELHLDYWPALMGWVVVVAGYVMTEAQSIAADNAEIV
jgi:hypothetical protein